MFRRNKFVDSITGEFLEEDAAASTATAVLGPDEAVAEPEPVITPSPVTDILTAASSLTVPYELVDRPVLEQRKLTLEKRLQNLLPIEEHTVATITAEISTISQKISRQQVHEAGFPELDPVILSWRHDQKMQLPGWGRDRNSAWIEKLVDVPVPKLAVFTTETATMTIDQYSVFPRLIGHHWHDVQKELAPIRHPYSVGRSEFSLQTRFTGVIPDRIRDLLVAGVAPFRPDELALIADAPFENWQTVEVQRTDPLVVGVKDGRMFLIDRFDPTPIERYIADEFAS